ncbi:MAG: diguanylate cyclase domain-containing protein [Thermochromatium sp.]
MLILLAIGIAVTAMRQLRLHARTIDRQMHVLKEAGLELEREATHDALTGLANRALFYRRLHQAIEHAREEGLKVAVLYIDLDDFKPVNDRYGHAIGNALLQAIADRLLQSVRATDTVARLGGDEFAMILPGLSDMGTVERIEHNIIAALRQPVHLDGHAILTGCSIGHALFPNDGDALDALLCAADTRIYLTKRTYKQGAETHTIA